MTDRAAQRIRAARLRAEAAQRRTDTRAGAAERRTRTRRLIELGGLVVKSGLADLVDDDRTAIYGALLMLVAEARSVDPAAAAARWKRRGKRAFDSEADAAKANAHSQAEPWP